MRTIAGGPSDGAEERRFWRPAHLRRARWRWVELVLLFFVVPLLPLTSLPTLVVIATMGGAAFGVLVYILRIKPLPKQAAPLRAYRHWRLLVGLFLGFVVISTIGVALFAPGELFDPPLRRPRLWLLLLFVYSGLSVFPQELVFRGFFFHRYRSLTRSEIPMVLVNAASFGLAHAFLGHWLPVLLTFLGGILFSTTYLRSRSVLVVSVEHALYGLWLFTVGLGTYFAFPV